MKTILNFTKIVCLLAVFFFQQNVNAQAPNKMSYQAVVRNASNALVASAPVGIKISILQGSASGTAVYEESHTVTTNANGLASIEIGSGTVISGTMAGINWGAGPYFMKTETDPAGGTAYSITGTSELMSVPYALYAASGNAGPQGPAGPQGIQGIPGSSNAWGLTGNSGTNGSNYIGTSDASDLNFKTNGVNVMKLGVTGNVGIGNTTPDFPLSFPTTYGEKISLFGNAAARVGFGVQPGNFQMLGDIIGTDLTFGYGLSASPTELMRIKSSTGYVGIGTAAPDHQLTVLNTSNAGLLKLQSNVGSTQITMDDSGLDDVYLSTTQGNFDIWTGGNNKRLSVLTNGNVGIGTSSPTSTLDVNGQITIDQKNFGGYGGLLIKGNAPGNNYPNICFSVKNNAATPIDEVAGYIGGSINSNVAGAEAMDLSFLTSQSGQLGLSERLRIKDNGNIGVGTITPTTKLEVNGGTKLGSNAPAVKMLKLTGTTGNTQGGTISIPHGLNSSKILAVNILVQYASGASVPPSYTINGGFEYHYYVTPNNIDVWTKSGSSASILSAPITILVTYEE
jgi:hypothetical protein